MRGVRFTKAEWHWLTDLVDYARCRADHGEMNFGEKKAARARELADSILTKLNEAAEPRAAGVAAGPLEKALIETSMGKVVSLVNGSKIYGRVSAQATAVGATPETARQLGAWIASQRWLTGPVTILTVLNKWPDWMARAAATAAPEGIDPGIAGDVGPGAKAKRPSSTAGRRPPGIG